MNTKDIEFTLIQNALDSVKRGVELLAWKEVSDEGSRLKQAIQHIAHAVELLLKERLRRIHPSLIWEDVDKYPRLDARTVGVDKAIHRLENIGGISISLTDSKIVKSLRDTRNAIEHFGWKTNRQEANVIIGQGLSFAIQFAYSELGTDIAYLFRDDDTWEQLLEEHGQFALAHGKRVEELAIGEGKPVQECGFCKAMAQDILTGACSICGHWEKSTSFGDFEDEPF
jgi:hypothetical protein